MHEFGSLNEGRSYSERVEDVRYLLREEDHIHVRPGTVRYYVNTMVQSGSLREDNLGKELKPGSEEIDEAIVDEFKRLRLEEGGMRHRVMRVKQRLKGDGIEISESGLQGRIKAMVAKGVLDERNLGKQAPPSDQELEERAKFIEAQARDPKNDFKINKVAKATGLSIATVRNAIMQRIAPGWEPGIYMDHLILEHLWRARREHNMDLDLMREHLNRGPKIIERYRKQLRTARELAELATEHGKPIGVRDVIEEWHTYNPIVNLSHSREREGRIKILKQHKII